MRKKCERGVAGPSQEKELREDIRGTLPKDLVPTSGELGDAANRSSDGRGTFFYNPFSSARQPLCGASVAALISQSSQSVVFSGHVDRIRRLYGARGWPR